MSLFALYLLAGLIPTCKPHIQTFPIYDRESPLAHLDDGNYVVSAGYVYYHVQMMAKIKVLEARVEELQKALEKR